MLSFIHPLRWSQPAHTANGVMAKKPNYPLTPLIIVAQVSESLFGTQLLCDFANWVAKKANRGFFATVHAQLSCLRFQKHHSQGPF